MEQQRPYHLRPIKERVWCARVHYIDGRTEFFPVKNPHNVNNSQMIDEKSKARIVRAAQMHRYKTRTGLLQAGIFTIKEAHYFAFGQAGFGIKNIEIMAQDIEYDPVTQKVEIL